MLSFLRRRPLSHTERARRLAASIDRVRRDARTPHGLQPSLFRCSVVRVVDRDLAATAALLRDARPAPTAVVRAERLLTDPRSPLYGSDPRRLRAELRGLLA